MTIRVLLFGSLAHALGVRDRALSLPEGATAGDALDAVAQLYPAFAPLRARTAVAVNMEYVNAGDLLREGDEVALIPPVSGG